MLFLTVQNTWLYGYLCYDKPTFKQPLGSLKVARGNSRGNAYESLGILYKNFIHSLYLVW